MQNYIEGTNRHQSYFSTLEEQVSTDNAVLLIDAFIDKLNLEKLGFSKSYIKAKAGRPYAPQVLLKLYLSGIWIRYVVSNCIPRTDYICGGESFE